MKLLVQPGDGLTPLLKAIQSARTSVDIAIFRFDRREIERALANAVSRGVAVHALVAHVNRSGEDSLRDLEMRLLGAGVTVARTASDLVRYHGKYMIIDRRELHLFAFNFTYMDMEHSRSFGVVTSNRRLVQESLKLFEADCKRAAYTPGFAGFIVSPLNARKQLASFIRGAKTQLLIYDPAVSDPAMIRLLEERAKAGVEIKIIGRLVYRGTKLAVHKLPRLRLHTRSIVRDNEHAFVGSQSLRAIELDARREVGVIFRDRKVVSGIARTFQEDWNLVQQAKEQERQEADAPATRVAKKVAKALAKELPPVTPVLEQIIREMGCDSAQVELIPAKVEETVKDAVKAAVKEAVRDAVENGDQSRPA